MAGRSGRVLCDEQEELTKPWDAAAGQVIADMKKPGCSQLLFTALMPLKRGIIKAPV